MAQEHVETVGRMVEAFNASGFSATALEFFDPDVTFEEPPEQPAPRVARGLDAAREVFGQFDEACRDGLEIDQPSGTIFTFRNGRVIRMQSFWEQASALAAAGL